MWKIALAISLTASCAYSQGTRRFVPPETRRVTGAVVDQAGEAIANARVFDNDRYPAYETGPDGRFDFDTKAPAIIVRKPGFESVIVRTQDASEIPVTLQKLTRTFPICSSGIPHQGIEGWNAAFRFPKMPGIRASRQTRDSDYGIRSYYVRAAQGKAAITHSSGYLQSFGMPNNRYMEQSTRYEEAVFNVGGVTIVDARRESLDGRFSHFLGKFGETARILGRMKPQRSFSIKSLMAHACNRNNKPSYASNPICVNRYRSAFRRRL